MTRRMFTLSLAASTALAEETSKARGKRLVDKAIQGLGGDAFLNMRTRTEVGRASSFYREQLTGYSIAHIYTKYLDPDGGTGFLELQRQAFGKKLDDAVIFTSNDAYEVTFRGARPLADDKIKQFRESAMNNIFYILRQRLSERGMEFEAIGSDVVENQSVEGLDIFDSENRNVRVWFNANTFLPVKQRYYEWDPTINDRREEVARFTTYRDAGGVMWPYTITHERDTERTSETRSERVTINDALADSLFELPNGIKILKK